MCAIKAVDIVERPCAAGRDSIGIAGWSPNTTIRLDTGPGTSGVCGGETLSIRIYRPVSNINVIGSIVVMGGTVITWVVKSLSRATII